MRFASNTIAITVSTVLVGVTCAIAWNEVRGSHSPQASTVTPVVTALPGEPYVSSGTTPAITTEVLEQLPATSTVSLLPTWPTPGAVPMVVTATMPTAASAGVPVVTLPPVTLPPVTLPPVTVPIATLPPVTAPPATSPAPTTTAASRQRYSVTGVPVPSSFVIPRTWTKPIPDWPAGCVAGQLEDNGVWNCQR